MKRTPIPAAAAQLGLADHAEFVESEAGRFADVAVHVLRDPDEDLEAGRDLG